MRNNSISERVRLTASCAPLKPLALCLRGSSARNGEKKKLLHTLWITGALRGDHTFRRCYSSTREMIDGPVIFVWTEAFAVITSSSPRLPCIATILKLQC